MKSIDDLEEYVKALNYRIERLNNEIMTLEAELEEVIALRNESLRELNKLKGTI